MPVAMLCFFFLGGIFWLLLGIVSWSRLVTLGGEVWYLDVPSESEAASVFRSFGWTKERRAPIDLWMARIAGPPFGLTLLGVCGYVLLTGTLCK